jgi:hypothetical protein
LEKMEREAEEDKARTLLTQSNSPDYRKIQV